MIVNLKTSNDAESVFDKAERNKSKSHAELLKEAFSALNKYNVAQICNYPN